MGKNTLIAGGQLVNITINGESIKARFQSTILEAARAQGIEIPALCADPRLKPSGDCGLCVVEVKGRREPVLACDAKVTAGIEIITESDFIAKKRQAVLNEKLADHNAYCEPPCHYACPAGIDIPGYIAAVARGDSVEAVRIVKERLPLPRVIGRVCPRPCEDVCRRSQIDQPVAICQLKRFAGDRAAMEAAGSHEKATTTAGKKAAVIGSGPSGLSAAYYLALAGHDVTIFEAHDKPGGMLQTAIPAFRLPRRVVEEEIDDILRLGVKLRLKTRLGRDFTVESLKKQGFEGIYLAIGAQTGLAGQIVSDGESVLTALDFLARVDAGTWSRPLGNTVVIGGGFTAVDAARSAVRLGAGRVTIVYRRTRVEMPATGHEVKEAEREGVELRFLAAPSTLIRQNGRLTALKCREMKLGEPDAGGRRRPIAVAGSDFTVEADTIILALGQEVDAAGLDDAITYNQDRTLSVNKLTLMTGVEGVFAGGDCVSGPATVVEAIAAGRRAAIAMDAYLKGSDPEAACLEALTGLERRPPAFFDIGAKPLSNDKRFAQPELAVERRSDFAEVELGFDQAAARAEAERCLQCYCHAASDCALQRYAVEYGAGTTEFKGEQGQYEPLDGSPFLELDRKRCIKCHNCVRICDEVQHQCVYLTDERGHPALKGKTYRESDCVFCGQCLSACPTGALKDLSDRGVLRKDLRQRRETLCAYCGVGCRFEVEVENNEIVAIKNQLGAGVNQGNLCVKGRFGFHFVGSPDRLTKPLVKRDGKFVETSWAEAIKLIAGKLNEIKAVHGADAIGGLASAKCTNEENYVFQKFMRAAVGTNNVDHCARLCHASTVAALEIAFGSGAMSNSIGDLEETDAILVIGSNTTEAHPVIGMSLLKAVRQNGAKLIVIDPRAIKLTQFADIWLAQKPGTDVAVLNGLMNVILEEGLTDEAFIAERTEGYEACKKGLSAYTPEVVEKISGVPAGDLRAAARLFAEAGKGCIVWSMGITQHTTGVDNVLAIANLGMITGNVGKAGAGISPLRGQNNVQGSCDMGALPNVFSGYQRVNDEAARAKMASAWGVELSEKPGLTVVEMMNGAGEGKIKALFIMGENPMLSDPDVGHVEEALEKLDFLVVQDIFLTETAALADVVLPGVTFAERDGTFTNTERRVQRFRQAVVPIGGAREDWRIISDIATAMGYPISYNSAAEIMAEVAHLTPLYGGITHARLKDGGLQWPCPAPDHPGTPMLHIGQFTRGLGKFHPVDFKPPAEEPDIEYPMILTTGRLLNQYHTGTMTRRTNGLDEIGPVAAAEISPKDARKHGLANGDKVRLITRRGEIEATALVTDRSRPGIVFMPFHFKEAAANRLTNPALDPIAKIPEFKVCALRIEKA